MPNLSPRLLSANELGIRLEIVGGIPLWEAQPLYKHQKAVDRIRASIQLCKNAGCQCVHVADVYVAFADGSLKRPDISIFCQEPADEDEAIKQIPEAVVEVISKGYEFKDLEIGPNFYLAQGVKDVVVFNPYTLAVLHIRRDQVTHGISPYPVQLQCGCQLLA